MSGNKPIGVFDSGLGGLSVLRELTKLLPKENYLYLGDTGRNPYGPKSTDTIIQYTLEAASFLEGSGAKLMVIACNTATVAALEAVQKACPSMPVIGVVEPGCLAAAEVARKHIVLLATQGTVKSGVHAARLAELCPNVKVTGIPAPILVALAEEGWLDGLVADAAAERYLGELFKKPDSAPDCLILGCTHFPLLLKSILKAVGEKTAIIDPAVLTARHVLTLLQEHNILNTDNNLSGKSRYCVTAGSDRFSRVGSMFLQKPVTQNEIEVIQL
jgi:glutamate racemase